MLLKLRKLSSLKSLVVLHLSDVTIIMSFIIYCAAPQYELYGIVNLTFILCCSRNLSDISLQTDLSNIFKAAGYLKYLTPHGAKSSTETVWISQTGKCRRFFRYVVFISAVGYSAVNWFTWRSSAEISIYLGTCSCWPSYSKPIPYAVDANIKGEGANFLAIL